MNGVAREFWSEVFDLRAPVPDQREQRPGLRRKKVRLQLVRRPGRAVG